MSLSKYTPKHTTTTVQNSKVNVKKIKTLKLCHIHLLAFVPVVFSSKVNICEYHGKILSRPNMCHQELLYSVQNIYPCACDKIKDLWQTLCKKKKKRTPTPLFCLFFRLTSLIFEFSSKLQRVCSEGRDNFRSNTLSVIIRFMHGCKECADRWKRSHLSLHWIHFYIY